MAKKGKPVAEEVPAGKGKGKGMPFVPGKKGAVPPKGKGKK